MDAKQVIRSSLGKARWITQMLLEDLSDEDLLVRPCGGANHTAWQLGHLASSEHRMLSAAFPGKMPPLPGGFAERHDKKKSSSDNPADFCTKSEYTKVLDEQRQGTLRLLETVEAAGLDEPGPESMRKLAPTIGDLFAMAGAHELMHQGQFSVVRRKLGKPNVF